LSYAPAQRITNNIDLNRFSRRNAATERNGNNMKRVYVNEEWCLGCHLCEYNCAFANSGIDSMVKALRGKTIRPRIRVEGDEQISFAVSCRHCTDPLCVKSCIAGALSIADGAVRIDRDRCVSCFTCVLVCPYGCMSQSENGVMQKCELCLNNSSGEPACVKGCPNRAIVFEGR
jgi:carbon-monoxide dehydrogenase iron sulfur subunit